MIDFKATLYDGSFHTVDSDELSFRLAGQLATRKGIQESSPVLLEPIMDVEVQVPEEYMGDVNRDLNTRRGRVLGMDSSDGAQVVRAHVPQAELFNYATELRSHVRRPRRRSRPRSITTRKCRRTWRRRSIEAHKKKWKPRPS